MVEITLRITLTSFLSQLEPSLVHKLSGGGLRVQQDIDLFIADSLKSCFPKESEIMPALLFFFLWRTRRACEIAGRRPRLGAMLV